METAEQRKQRLKAMREAAEVAEGGDAPATMDHQPTTENSAPPTLKFRNYALRDEKIEHEKVGVLALVVGCMLCGVRTDVHCTRIWQCGV